MSTTYLIIDGDEDDRVCSHYDRFLPSISTRSKHQRRRHTPINFSCTQHQFGGHSGTCLMALGFSNLLVKGLIVCIIQEN